MTVTGSNFPANPTVMFGTTQAPPAPASPPSSTATIVSATSTQIVVTVPASGSPPYPGTVQVTVTGPNGSAATPYTYAWGQPPITSVTPDVGYTSGNQLITVTGTNFDPGTTTVAENTTVALGYYPASQVSINAAGTQLTFNSPAVPGQVANGNVGLLLDSTGGNTSTLFFETLAPPSIINVSPSATTTDGGATITVSGAKLDPGNTQVAFGDYPASNVSVSPTGGTITFTAPAVPVQLAGQDVEITVTTDGMTAVADIGENAPPPTTPSAPPPPSPPASNPGNCLNYADTASGCTSGACIAVYDPFFASTSCHFRWVVCHADLWESFSSEIADYVATHSDQTLGYATGISSAAEFASDGTLAAACGTIVGPFLGVLIPAAKTIYAHGGCLSFAYDHAARVLSGGAVPNVPIPPFITVDGGGGCR